MEKNLYLMKSVMIGHAVGDALGVPVEFASREELENGLKYAELQRRAIVEAMSNGVMILTGGPGTGKTTAVRGIVALFERMGLDVLLAAPTGRAAKRMAVGRFDVRVPVHGRDEVAELAVAFNQMSQALETLERMRNSFVANVSHDLRTPMTTISGFIDGILDGIIPQDRQEHYLRVVSEEVRRLSRLVTALLDVSRLKAGDRKFDMKPFDICEMGRQILISFEQNNIEKLKAFL